MQTQTISYKQIILLILAILCFVFAFATSNLTTKNSISTILKSQPKPQKKPQSTGIKIFVREEDAMCLFQ